MTSCKNTLKRQSSLGHARGHGSAHQGTHHWLVQRATSVALVGLGLWFIYALLTRDLLDQGAVIIWLKSPWNLALMSLTLGVALYHGYLGLQVVIEDYIHCEGFKVASLWVIKGIFIVLLIAALYSLLTLQLRGLPVHV